MSCHWYIYRIMLEKKKKTVKHRKRRGRTFFRGLFTLLAIALGCGVKGGTKGIITFAPDRTKEYIVLTQDSLPEYMGEAYVTINGNVPEFSKKELSSDIFEAYSELDALGRCGTAEAMLSRNLMPTEPRGEIGMIRPTGWHTVKYDVIEDRYLFNRCHLLAFELTGENDNEKNLITGTRYMNVSGMLPWENKIARYIRKTDDKVFYRVTPVFKGNELVARGVHMEAKSVKSDEIQFNIYVFNVQPGVRIDYRTGESWLEGQ